MKIRIVRHASSYEVQRRRWFWWRRMHSFETLVKAIEYAEWFDFAVPMVVWESE